ncbi:MAG: hypothetical protein O3C30_01615 [Proteobacteria bacterium]|nr:hypothetical protein [Pseudomonadota bacterium]
MTNFTLSPKGQKLVEMYTDMVDKGYKKVDGTYEANVYNDFELKKIRGSIKERFKIHRIKTVLDYGCGGSDWSSSGFNEDQSAFDFFELDRVYRYEPARSIDERTMVDAVICFDVLEHIFVSDVANVIRDIFSCAEKLVVPNVACYPANATLPNGENAHVTIRNPEWWKGVVDTISVEFPNVSVTLICSPTYNKMLAYPTYSDHARQSCDEFCLSY